jgi:putative acetyltransferase
MRFVVDDLTHPEVLELLRFHIASAHANSPPEKVHALDLSGLRDPAVTFWSVWDGDALVGMGALKMLGGGRAEIKSMRVAPAHLRRGIGRAILDHLIAEARARGVAWLGLETGGNDAFVPARAMYEAAGFVECAAFGDYVIDDFSRCYSLKLTG